MSDRGAVKHLVESCDSKASAVLCPHQGQSASITAARWQTRDGRWTAWVVVDCPFLAAGTVSCDMRCLTQLDSTVESH